MKRPDLITAALLLLFVAAWEILCRTWQIPTFILPPPSLVLTSALKNSPLLAEHSLVTAFEILAGVILSVLVSVPLAVAMFLNRGIERAISPLLIASQAVPVFAIAPLLVVWLGYGMASKILMASVIIFFPITISLLEGFKSVSSRYDLLFSLMNAGTKETFLLLYWPSAMPYFLAGLKVGVSVATIGAVIGEWVGSQKGLGYLMIQANARLNTEIVFASILWLSGLGLFLWYSVSLLEKKVLYWKKEV